MSKTYRFRNKDNKPNRFLLSLLEQDTRGKRNRFWLEEDVESAFFNFRHNRSTFLRPFSFSRRKCNKAKRFQDRRDIQRALREDRVDDLSLTARKNDAFYWYDDYF